MKKAVQHTMVILLIFTLSVSTAFLTYLHFLASDNRDLSGEWTAELGMTRQAAAAAYIWLQDIEAVTVSLEDMESYMQELSVQAKLTFEETARDKGTFHCIVLPESYDDCEKDAYEILAMVFREALAKRLQMAGYEEDTDEDAIEALVTETFGTSTVSYLMTYGPSLLPPLEDLQKQYEGSGIYEVSEDILTRQFETGQITETTTEYYMRKESVLILLGTSDSGSEDSKRYAVMYTFKQQ